MKKILAAGVLMVCAVSIYAEPIRTVTTKENKFPKQGQVEVGSTFLHQEEDLRDVQDITPYLRVGVVENLAVFARVPYRNIDPDVGKKESGWGDVGLGLELRVYEDIFRYPWIILHGEATLDTGDEKKGLGESDNTYTVGIAAGTTVNDEVHFAVDVRYTILDDVDNIPSVALSVVWDLDKQFSLLSELEVAREKRFGQDEHPITFLAGMYYKATRNLHFGLYGGTTKNSPVDTIILGKAAYSF